MPYIFVGVFSCSFNLDRSRMFTDTTRITVFGTSDTSWCMFARMFTWPMSFMHPSWWSPPWCYSGPPSCFEWRRNRIEEYVDQRRSKWIKLVYFPFYEQSHFLRVICQHASLPAVIEWRQGSKIMDKTSWIKQCLAVWSCLVLLLAHCLR